MEKEKEREALQKKTKDKKDKKGRKTPSKTGSPSKTETPPRMYHKPTPTYLCVCLRVFVRKILFFCFNFLSCFVAAPSEDQEGQSEEEKLKQKIKERARKEFLGAVSSEGNSNFLFFGSFFVFSFDVKVSLANET